jgi:hypothetical protein
MATENDLKYLLNTYQKKSMDLFTQLVVAETKLEQALTKIAELEEKLKQCELNNSNNSKESY